MKKLLLGIAGFLLLATAGSLWLLYNSLDAQIASAIRRYGPEITGVPVSLSGISISVVDGKAALYGLVVGNPDNFKTKHALSLSEISVTLDIGSLTTDVIRIKELTVIKSEVTYEYASAGAISTSYNATSSALLLNSVVTRRKSRTRNPARNSSSNISTSRTVPPV